MRSLLRATLHLCLELIEGVLVVLGWLLLFIWGVWALWAIVEICVGFVRGLEVRCMGGHPWSGSTPWIMTGVGLAGALARSGGAWLCARTAKRTPVLR